MGCNSSKTSCCVIIRLKDLHNQSESYKMERSSSWRSNNSRDASSSDNSVNVTQKSGIKKSYRPRKNSSKLTDVEKEIRRLLLERTYLQKNLYHTEEECRKTQGRLQRAIQEKTSLGSTVATLKKEIKELKKSNDVLKTKVKTLESTGFRRKDLQIDLANARGSLVSKDHEISELQLQVKELQKTIEKQTKTVDTQEEEIELLRKTLHEELRNATAKCRNLSLENFEELEELETISDSIDHPTDSLEDDIFESVQNNLKTDCAKAQLEKDALQMNSLNNVQVTSNANDYKDTLENRISSLKSYNTNLEEQCENSLQIISSLTSENERLTHELATAEEVLAGRNNEWAMLMEELKQITSTNENLNKEIKDLSATCEELKNTIDALERLHKNDKCLYEEELFKAKEEINEKQNSINIIMTDKNELKETLRKYEILCRNQKNDLLTMENVIEESQKKKAIYKNIATASEMKNSEIEKQNHLIKKQLKEAEKEKSDLENLLKEKTDILQKLDIDKETTKSSLVEKNKEIECLHKKLHTMEAEFHQKIEAMKNEEENERLEKRKLEETISTMMTEKEMQIQKILELQKSVDLMRKETVERIADLENDISKLNNDKKKLASYLKESESKALKLAEINKELQESIDTESALVMEYKAKIESLDKTVTDLNNKLKYEHENNNQHEIVQKNLEVELELKEDRIKKLSLNIEQLNKNYNTATASIMDYENSLKNLQKRLTDKDELLSSTYSKLRDAEDEALEKHNIVEKYSSKLTELERRCLMQDETLKNNVEQFSNLKLELINKEKELMGCYVERKELKIQLQLTEEDKENYVVDSHNLKQELNNIKLQCKNIYTKIEAITNDSDSLKNPAECVELNQSSIMDNLNKRIDNLISRFEEITFQNWQLSGELEVSTQRQETLTDQIAQLETSMAELENVHNEPATELKTLINAANEQLNLIVSLQTENAELKETKEKLESELQRCKAQIEWHENRERRMLTEVVKLENELASEKKEALRWKNLLQELEAKVEPFKEQLDMFAAEKEALLSQNCEALSEVQKVSQQYALLLGHQNHKQKIHHVLKLKEENLKYKQEILQLRDQLTYLQRKCQHYQTDGRSRERRFDVSKAFKHDKENNPLRKKTDN